MKAANLKLIALPLLLISISISSRAENPLAGAPDSVVKLHQALYGKDCDTDTPEKTQIFEAGKAQRVYLVSCIAGAYQTGYKGYLSTDGGATASPIIILNYESKSKRLYATTELVGAQFAPATNVLSAVALGRGLGGCGQSSSSIINWDYPVAAATVEIRNKDNCDDSNRPWPVVFKQK